MKKKVLHVMNGAVSGGISKFVLNVYNTIDRSKYQFDCAMYDTKLGANGNAIVSLGAQIFELPVKSKSPIKFAIVLYKLLVNGEYDVIHVHSNASSFYPLLIAKFTKTQVRVAHAHTNRVPDNMKEKIKFSISHLATPFIATDMVACSRSAAISIFGRRNLDKGKTTIFNNGIETKQFKYNGLVRDIIRSQLGLYIDDYIIGCVGNLGPEKNIEFAIRVLKTLVQKGYSNLYLIIIGDGPLREQLELLSADTNNKVLFLGRKENVHDYLQAFDAFVMPSLYEGFGIAALEAAASGLPIYLSTNIPSDFEFYSRCHYLSLEKGENEWANCIIADMNKSEDRNNGYNEIKNAGYDLKDNISQLEQIYNK